MKIIMAIAACLLPTISLAGNIIRVAAPIQPGAVIEAPAEEILPNSCLSLKIEDPSRGSGIYSIQLNQSPVVVYCDMDTDGGGWTLVGRGYPGDVRDWTTSINEINPGAVPTPSSTYTFRLSEASINAIPRQAIKTVTLGYSNTRFFKGSCAIKLQAMPVGDCAISYSSEKWEGARGNGSALSYDIGLADRRGSVPNDGFYVALGNTAYPHYGWAAGDGVKVNNSGAGSVGTPITLNLWVR